MTSSTSYDPRAFRAGPDAQRVSEMSHADAQQLLCDCIEALEQFEGHAFEAMRLCEAWRRDQVEPAHTEDAAPDASPPSNSRWRGLPAEGTDADGVPNLLPTRYALEGYLWHHRGAPHAVSVSKLDKGQTQQALCQTLEVLGRLERELFGLQRLLVDWKAGSLRPTSDFDISEQ